MGCSYLWTLNLNLTHGWGWCSGAKGWTLANDEVPWPHGSRWPEPSFIISCLHQTRSSSGCHPGFCCPSPWGPLLCLKQACTSRTDCCSVAQSCRTLCGPMDCNTPGIPAHYQLPELAQTRVHRIGDAIKPSHPLRSPSPPALNLSQHQSLFQ